MNMKFWGKKQKRNKSQTLGSLPAKKKKDGRGRKNGDTGDTGDET
jgi:hypothetical protein